MKSVKSILTSKYTWAVAFVVCCIITFGLNISNTTDHCTWSFNGISIHGSGGCNDDNIPDEICTTAMEVKRNDIQFIWTGKTYPNSPMTKKCSWHIYTSFFNYLAIVCDAAFVVLFVKYYKRNNFKRVLSSGAAATLSTVVSIILMIIDAKSGSKQIKKMQAKYTSGKLSYSQSVFDANIAFGILSLIFLIILVLLSFKIQRDQSKNPENGYNVPKKKKNNAAKDNGDEYRTNEIRI